MGKILAQVIAITPLEVRQKKDGSGEYKYCDVSLQIQDCNGQLSYHETFDWRTGNSNGKKPDFIKFDKVHDDADALYKSLSNNGITVGTWVWADISMEPNRFGRNEVTVVSIMKWQQMQQSPTNAPY